MRVREDREIVMAEYAAGTKVRVTDYEDPNDPRTIVGEVGTVVASLQDREADNVRLTRVSFTLPDDRNGEWLFLDDEIEAVE